MAIDRGRLASLVAERSDWYERVAHTDPLTGLANQRTFARVLELELARASRQGSEVSLAIFDVDDFAATNEAAGREAGDDVLRAVASVLAETVRLSIGRLRRLLFELRPPALDRDGLAAAVRLYLQETSREAGFEARRSLDDGIRELIKAYRMEGRGLFKNAA